MIDYDFLSIPSLSCCILGAYRTKEMPWRVLPAGTVNARKVPIDRH